MAVAAGAAAAGAKLLGGSDAEADDIIAGQFLKGGRINFVYADGTKNSGTTTYISSNVPNFSTLNVINSGGADSDFAPALQAFGQSMGIGARSPSGSAPKINPGDRVGVRAFGATHGVWADSAATGVYGKGPARGVWGESDDTAVYGDGAQKGVHGNSGAFGVYGVGGVTGVYGSGGIGVEGSSFTTTGVVARALGADPKVLAFEAAGPVRFSSAGDGTVLKDQKNATVTGVHCPAKSRILVTLNGDSGAGNALRWARRVNDTSFKVQLLAETPKNVKFSYFIMLP
jgi:hypothetical protein